MCLPLSGLLASGWRVHLPPALSFITALPVQTRWGLSHRFWNLHCCLWQCPSLQNVAGSGLVWDVSNCLVWLRWLRREGPGGWWLLAESVPASDAALPSRWAWILQDALGIAFCLYMLKTIRLPTFKVRARGSGAPGVLSPEGLFCVSPCLEWPGQACLPPSSVQAFPSEPGA